MSFLKPKAATSSSTSSNVNNGLVTSTYTPQMQAGTGATNFLAQMLGVSPSGVANTAGAIGSAANGVAEAGGANAGYQNYLQTAGYAPAMRQMSEGVVGQGAAQGLLNSGATENALLTKGTELNNQFYNNYMQQISGLAGIGTQGGQLVANTGQVSNSKSTGGGPSTAGSIASAVGGIASVFSDRRLKVDVRKIGETVRDGIPVYRYRYHGAEREHEGVMADDVARIRPDALGPLVAGFQTVNYERL